MNLHRVFSRSSLARTLAFLLTLVLSSCTGLPVYSPKNLVAPGQVGSPSPEPDPREIIVWLALSGGGTRAAALAYGVMERLQEVAVQSDETQKTASNLLKEVDYISSVSGGSFAAAFYSLNKDNQGWGGLFKDHFLYQNIQSAVLTRLFSPHNWLRVALTNYGRSDLAADYYDNYIFDGKKFRHLPERPQLIINSSDLVVGRRFEFTQQDFNCLGSWIADYRIADAVTASSAFPGAFTSILLENHGPHNECPSAPPDKKSLGRCLTVQESLSEQFVSTDKGEKLRNSIFVSAEKKRNYCQIPRTVRIHLSDGGITDNLGLEPLLHRLKDTSSRIYTQIQRKRAKALIVIAVNAATAPEEYLGTYLGSAWFGRVLLRGTDIFLEKASLETLRRTREEVFVEVQRLSPSTDVYFLEVTFEDIKDPVQKHRLQNLPTSLKLEQEEVVELIEVGRQLLEEGRDGDNGRDLEKICRDLFGPVKLLKAGERCIDVKP